MSGPPRKPPQSNIFQRIPSTGAKPASHAILAPSRWMQLLPGGFSSSVPPTVQEPAQLKGKLYLRAAKGEQRERKGALSWKDWFTFLKKMPVPQRAAGFWLWMELKGFENDLGDLGCWHLTEPSLQPGLVIQGSGSGELPRAGNFGGKNLLFPHPTRKTSLGGINFCSAVCF